MLVITSLTLRDGQLREFENKLLRRMFGLKREEVAGEWRRLHEELHKFYGQTNITRVIKPRRIS
jgi:hypothetical protein